MVFLDHVIKLSIAYTCTNIVFFSELFNKNYCTSTEMCDMMFTMTPGRVKRKTTNWYVLFLR